MKPWTQGLCAEQGARRAPMQEGHQSHKKRVPRGASLLCAPGPIAEPLLLSHGRLHRPLLQVRKLRLARNLTVG